MPKHVTGTHDGSLETQRFDPRIRIRSDERAIAEQSKAAIPRTAAERRAAHKAMKDRETMLARQEQLDEMAWRSRGYQPRGSRHG